MIKTWLRPIAIGLLIFIVALVITAPAVLVENQLISKVKNLSIQDTSGGIWSGKFQGISYNNQSLNELSWSFAFSSLFMGKIGADLTIDDLLFKGILSIEKSLSSELLLFNINGQQPVSVLASRKAMINQLYPQGEIVWNNVSIKLTDNKVSAASGIIQWQNASFKINGNDFILGTINLSLDADNGDLLLNITDDDSVLKLEGILRLGMDRRYNLEASVTESLPDDIGTAFKFIGRSNGKGRITFRIPGKL